VKLLKTLLTIFLINLSGCGTNGIPPTPEADLCTIDLVRSQLICYPIGGLVPRKNTTLNSTIDFIENRDAHYIPLDLADKYIAFSPDSYAAISGYISELVTIVKRKCR
jgi:hypothetical protein